jgi:hypothetical protein
MSDNYRDKIQEIRARRQGGMEMGRQNGSNQPGSGMGAEQAAAATLGGVGATTTNKSGDRIASNIGGRSNLQTVQETQTAAPLFAPGTSPFGTDKVSLSLEGQIAMMEQRGQNKLSSVDLGYTNRSTILPVKNGIYVKVEPPGTYRLAYHNRTSTN